MRFDCYEVDLSAGVLRKRGLRLPLREQSFQVLAALLERPGDVITRAELCARLWHGDVTVDFENNLNAAIARLRQVLCDRSERPQFIETMPKRGYRFIGQAYSVPAVAEGNARRARLLVLPFANLSHDPAQECFSDALTDELITAIAALAPKRLAVIARTTAMHYKGTRKDVGRISSELAVDYVVEGGMSRTRDQVAINVQLIHSRDQAHLFARKYGGPLREMFQLENRIIEDLTAQIPGAAEQRKDNGIAVVARHSIGTEDLAAYHQYIQGRYHVGKATAKDLAAAKAHLERAVARDPEFAAAYDALAELFWYRGYFGMMPPREAFSAGLVHALRALEIDNSRAETHALLGQFHKTIEYNWTEVHREMELALQLDPTSPVVRTRYAVSELMPHARLDEAVAQLERALEVDPLAFFARMWLGLVFMLQRRYERALVEARKLLELDPNYVYGHFIVAMASHYMGKGKEAIAGQRRVAELSGGATTGWLGLILAAHGQATEARALLRRLHGIAGSGYVPPTTFAWIHLGLKEVDAAFEWLNRAVEECDQLMMPIKSYGLFDPIRSDPRFTVLLRKMRLAS